MAFGKRSTTRFRRTFRKKGPTTSSLARTKASKRFNWVTSFDTVCDSYLLPPHACRFNTDASQLYPQLMDCTDGTFNDTRAEPIRFELLPPNLPDGTSLAAYASDDVTLVRVVGKISLMPVYYMNQDTKAAYDNISSNDGPGRAEAFLSGLRVQRNYFLRAGLTKDAYKYNGSTQQYDYPSGRDPMDTVEWTDGRYLRQWEREKMIGELGRTRVWSMAEGSTLGVYGNVTKNAQPDQADQPDTTLPGWALATGTGTWAGATIQGAPGAAGDPEITTTEQFSTLDAGLGLWQSYLEYESSPDRRIDLSLNSRRRLRFRENEGLNMWINYTAVDYSMSVPDECNPTVSPPLGVGFLVRLHAKLLIET